MNNKNHSIQALVSLISATLLITLNIFFYATFSVYSGSPTEFELGYFDIVTPLWWSFILFSSLIILPGLIPRPDIVRRYISFVFGLGILTWLQANFLLWDYGVFDGRGLSLDQYDVLGWLDLLLWLTLLITLVRFARRIFPLVTFLAWILLVGQAVLLISQADKTEVWKQSKAVNSEMPEAFLNLSAKQNIFHIILDSFQTDVFLQLVEERGLQEKFSGFTLFFENAGVTPHTSVAIPAIFSGQLYDGLETPSAYYKNAILSGFHNTLYKKGYTVNLIPQLPMDMGSYSNYFEIPANFHGTKDDLQMQETAQLMDVALFRITPHFLRKHVYNDGNWLLLRIFRSDLSTRSFQEKAFFKNYIDSIRVAAEEPAYHFIHLNPPHPPYLTLEDGSYAGKILPNTRANYVNEAKAVFNLILLFIEKLKSLGIYDNALIVLQGDHGSQISPIVNGAEVKTCLPRLPALLAIKPPGKKHPLIVSDSPTTILDIAPTILHTVGETGASIFELDSAPRQRPFLTLSAGKDASKVTYYSINGSVFDPHSCQEETHLLMSAEAPIYKYGTEIQFGMTGNADPFLGVGWSACHARHCWSSGHQSVVTLPVIPNNTGLDLHVRLVPFINAPTVPKQRIRVAVNGNQLTEWLATKKKLQEFMVRIPASYAKSNELQISFEFPDAVRPASVGLGADKRNLAVAMVSLRINPVSNEE